MTRPSPSYILDISRLLSRAGQPIPTGIDRVELAYAEYLLAHHADCTHFVALNISGRMGALPYQSVTRFIHALLEGWNHGKKHCVAEAKKIARFLKGYSFLGCRALKRLPQPVIYLLLSHHHLMRTPLIKKFLAHTGAMFVPMVHDLIPIEYPEYARPREPKRHNARMQTVVNLATSVIVPTDDVNILLKRYFLKSGRSNVPICTVPHGVHTQALDCAAEDLTENHHIPSPYFVYLSTIEPRKNHLLLLHLWRKMVQENGEDATPKLILVGKRGWENENILDLLDRSPALQNVVLEKNNLSDQETISLLKKSNGLLFPSFTEGYGLPIAEAMSLSVPTICADIPVLREVGGTIPLYIDPLDSVKWQTAINDFSKKGSLWQEQKKKLENWQALPWPESIFRALSFSNDANPHYNS